MNFSRSALFHMKTRVCLKYFVNGCRKGSQTIHIKLILRMRNLQIGAAICAEKIFRKKNAMCQILKYKL